jgi:hypothetical protein
LFLQLFVRIIVFPLFSFIFFIKISEEFISSSFIFRIISHFSIQLFSAKLQETGDRIIQGFFSKIQLFMACSRVGISFKSREVFI